MAKLIYSAITSLDGYVADEDGKFNWSTPDEEVHAFVNDLERSVGTLPLRASNVRGDGRLGEPGRIRRRGARHPGIRGDLAGGREGRVLEDLEAVSSARTRIERDFDPDAIREMKARAARDLSVGGPELAAQAIEAGLVDELHLFLSPIVVGGGKPSLPDGVRLELDC